MSLEWRGREWYALGSTVLGPEPSAMQSFRPSESRPGHWTVIAAGLAPAESTKVFVSFGGREHLVPVVGGLYLFAVGVEDEPELKRMDVELIE